jgi:MraZ protein
MWHKVGQSGMIFIGTYQHTLDNKNRLVLPSKIASKLSKTIVVNKGLDNCLEIRDLVYFENFVSRLDKYSEMKKDVRIVRRHLLGDASDIEIDNAKRILIPNHLLQKAHIKKNVILIGVSEHLEI